MNCSKCNRLPDHLIPAIPVTLISRFRRWSVWQEVPGSALASIFIDISNFPATARASGFMVSLSSRLRQLYFPATA